MALFRYTTLLENGKKKKGIIDADNLKEAQIRLSSRRLAVVSLSPLQKRDLKHHFSKEALLAFSREIARLLSSGLPLYEVLLTLEEKYRKSKVHRIILDLCDQIKAGHSLSKAFRTHPKSFDFLYCAMIENAEKAGSLAATLEEISVLLSKQLTVKKQLQKALTYPCVLGIFCFVLVLSMLFFVIPSLFELFEERKLHPFTQGVMICSYWANHHKGFLMGILVLLAVSFSTRLVRRKSRELFLKVPAVHKIMTKIAIIRFCRAFATLLSGGVPYLKALRLAGKVMKYRLLEKEMKKAEKKIMEGIPLGCFLRENPLFPSLVARMLSIAHEGGNEPAMLLSIAELYEEDLEKTLAKITTFLQPALLLFLGVVVGFVVLAILLPLTDVSSFIGG